MKFMKRGLAILLAVLLMLPYQTVTANVQNVSEAIKQEEIGSSEKKASGEETYSTEISSEEVSDEDTTSEEPSGGELSSEEMSTEDITEEEVSGGDKPSEETAGEEITTEEMSGEDRITEETPDEEMTTEELSNDEITTEAVTEEETTEVLQETEPTEEILFNTGNCEYSVVGRQDFMDNGLGDACFEEDGSYTINIPEENPFFPYEVQFTYDGKVSSQWFMTPDDSVEIGGHTFYVSAYFDGTAVTQLSLKVAGDTVVVYPEEKEFTDGDGAMPLSLLPLDEIRMEVDLSSYTPAELTMVSVDGIFTGSKALNSSDKVVWTTNYNDDYTISTSGDVLDLSYETCYSNSNTWEMIVGDADQLAAGNKRYLVRVKMTKSADWLSSEVYKQDASGNRANVSVLSNDYADYNKHGRRLRITVPFSEWEYEVETYLKLDINNSVFSSTGFDHFKVYEGNYPTASEAVAGIDITDKICSRNMQQAGAGYVVQQYEPQWITMVTFDASGKATGCLPFELYLISAGNDIGSSLYDKSGTNPVSVAEDVDYEEINGVTEITYTLYSGYAANKQYHLGLSYYEAGTENNSAVTGAYVGQYSSIAEAASAGAADIKGALLDDDYRTGGYPSDYSQGVYITIFVGADGDNKQEVYHCYIRTKEGTVNRIELSDGTYVQFTGLQDQNGAYVNAYVADVKEDSYAEYNYLTILVDKTVDLTQLAPEFYTEDGIRLYAEGSSSPEKSGESIHDFSKGPVQYTAAAENGTGSKNYWLQIVKATDGAGWLYINSLADKEADTRTENGVVHSAREIMLDGYHDYVHDILLANMGKDAVSSLSVELSSDSVVLDDYWTLNGTYELSGCTTLNTTTSYGELPNLAKIRLKAKDGTANGTDISGTLTVKSGNKELIVLSLTGSIGDPSIITEEIPQAVKYVPYGTMIQNNNKYSWNRVKYMLEDGELPEGMEVKANGEIYGVPLETGEFTFTVLMESSNSSFSESIKTYTLIVAENTDSNVDAATDTGYNLTQRIQNVTPDSVSDQTLVSQGIYAEFVDIYLDGTKLQKGVDYTSESGSTRITIRSQTLKASNTPGTHTLGIEFRTQDTETLKRAAQNYLVNSDGDSEQGGGNKHKGNGNKGNSSSSGNSNVISQTETNQNAADSVVGGNAVNNGDAEISAEGNISADGAESSITYTVQKGDTLWKIAEKFYGSGAYWERIFQTNAAVLSNPNQIYAGQVLIIDLTVLNSETASENPDANYYTVKPGDSLYRIAVRFYGQGRYWRRIAQANDAIKDPKLIHAGQVIVIPEI